MTELQTSSKMNDFYFVWTKIVDREKFNRIICIIVESKNWTM